MPRCRHGSFQDMEYGVHGNQYEIVLVYLQPILEKKCNFVSESYRKMEKRNHKESFFHLWTAPGQEKKVNIFICKNYLESDYL